MQLTSEAQGFKKKHLASVFKISSPLGHIVRWLNEKAGAVLAGRGWTSQLGTSALCVLRAPGAENATKSLKSAKVRWVFIHYVN